MAKSRSRTGAGKRTTDWRRQDPNYQREQEQYGRAIPSRDFLQQHLSRREPLTADQVCRELDVEEDWAREAVRRRLGAMARDGQLVRNRRGAYGPAGKMDVLAGRVIAHPEGYGFLVPDDGSDDLSLPAREMRALMHGDRIQASVAGLDRRGRREGKLVEVLERNTQRLVGRYHEHHGVGRVVPDNRRLFHEILVPPAETAGSRDGQIVSVEIVEQPSATEGPVGRVSEVLGDHMAPGMEVEISIRAHGIRSDWPDALQAEIADLGEEVPEQAKAGRTDLRELTLVTIDGVTARDFDDAVYCERRRDRWRLIVAIADVSAYVHPGTALDEEAKARGTSVYFPDRVVPMLPEVLSNGLCSLNPKVDRLCMACDMTIDAEGEIVRARFVEAVMRSHARLTYDTVARVLLEDDRRLEPELEPLVPHLENLHGLYKVLRAARDRRGAIDFETQETVIEYGPEQKIERIVPSERNEAHMLIEECMIAANVAAARLLRRRRMPALFRVHHGPTQPRVEELRSFLGELGLFLPGGEKPTPHDYGALLEKAAERPDFHLIQTVLLRSLARAVYAPGKDGHFGLALPAYAHFTSPIRRYPDLIVHRAIRHLLRGGKPADYFYGSAEMERLGAHCSNTERNADEAVWDAIEWLKCEYMLDHVGEDFDGIITSVTSFGLFVELSEVYVEGLVHVTALANDYYHFDPVGRRLTGERSGAVYRLGDRIQVKVVQVQLDDRRIDFEPVGKAPKGARRGRRGRRGR